MKAEQLFWLCNLEYKEYVTRAMNDYIVGVQNGDENFDKALFADFFDFVGKNTSTLENAEFRGLFGVLICLAYDVAESLDDFEEHGELPLGIDSDSIGRFSLKVKQYSLFGVLLELEGALEFYEDEYETWSEEESDDYGVSNDDFLDYGRANALWYGHEGE